MSTGSKKNNAFKHGAFANQVVLWGEEPEEFETLLADLIAEWSPVGSSEENLVRRVAQLRWAQQRVARSKQLRMQQLLKKTRADSEKSRFLQPLVDLISLFKQAIDEHEVELILSDVSPEQGEFVRSNWIKQFCVTPKEWGPTIAAGLSLLQLPTPYEESAEFIMIVESTIYEESLESEQRMAAEIDRTIKRLVQLKTMKQMFFRLEPELVGYANVLPPSKKMLSEKDGPL